MRTNQLAFTAILSALYLSSCTEAGYKDYKYVETSMRTYMQDIVSTEQKPISIKAKSDSAAYINAYINFCLARKNYNEEFQKSGTMAGKPLSFKLLNEKSVDITESLNFMNRKQIEKNIEKRVSSFEFKKSN